MLYLFIAYLVLWAITFGYLFSLGTRQKHLQQELEQLRPESRARASRGKAA